MEQIERLVALEEIRGLAHRYAVAVDSRDLDALAALFPSNVDYGRWGTGPEGVKRFFQDSLKEFHCTVHLVGSHVIDIDDDYSAHGVVYCHGRHHLLERDLWYDEAFAYFDTYEKVDGSWVFRRRRLRSWYREEASGRTASPIEANGPKRGGRMPEAFPSFAAHLQAGSG